MVQANVERFGKTGGKALVKVDKIPCMKFCTRMACFKGCRKNKLKIMIIRVRFDAFYTYWGYSGCMRGLRLGRTDHGLARYSSVFSNNFK